MLRVSWRALLLVAVVCSALATGSGTAAGQVADDGLRVEVATDYLVIPEESRVAVTVTATATNELPDDPDGTYYTWDGLPLSTPAGVQNVAASVDGVEVATEVIETYDVNQILAVSFPNDLLYGQTQTVTLTFDIAGPLRSAAGFRVSPSHLWLPLWGDGDPGLGSITASVPEGLDARLVLDQAGFDRSVSDGFVVYTATELEDPTALHATVIGRNDEAHVVSEVDPASGYDIEIHAWADDAEWAGFVERVVVDHLAELEVLIGEPWPIEGPLKIVQTVDPYIYGYGGWFDHATNTIEVGPELEEHLIIHELSHAWLNEELFVDRWIFEGMAEELASQLAQGSGTIPADPPAVTPTDQHATPLAEWPHPSFAEPTGNDPEEDYAYDAAWLVMRSIREEVGADGLATVIDAAAADLMAYRGEDEDEASPGDADWRHFLDLLELTADSTEAESLFREYVLTDADLAELDARTEAQAAFDELDAADGDWVVPRGIRKSMEVWDFSSATDMIADAHEILAQVEAIEARAEGLGLRAPVLIEASYEGAEERFNKATQDLKAQEGALDAIERATAAADQPRNQWERIGLWGTDIDAELAAARSTFEAGDPSAAARTAAQLANSVDDATAEGQQRVAMAGGGALLVVLLLVLLGTRLVRRYRR